MTAWNYMNGTTAQTPMQMADSAGCLSGLEKRSFLEHAMPMQCLFGESLLTTALTGELESDSAGSIAPSSEMNRPTEAQTSFARRTRLLISSGLIAGITPTSIAKRSPQRTLDFAFKRPVGVDADQQPGVCLCSKG